MKVSLRELKENKGQKKEFKFLSKVSDYIQDKYGDIVDMLDKDNFEEILSEISNEGTVPFAFYTTPSTILITPAGRGVNYVETNYKEDKEVKTTVDKYRASIRRVKPETWPNYDGYTSNSYVDLIDLYYISDLAAFQDYLDSLKAEEHAKKIAELNKKEEERVAKEKEDRRLRETYGIKSDEDLKLARNIEAMTSEDPKERFKAFRGLQNSRTIGLDTDTMWEIATDAANEAISDHCYDEH